MEREGHESRVQQGAIMRFNVLVITTLTAISGCATGSKYVPAQGEATATVRLVTSSNSTGVLSRSYNFFLSTKNTCSAERMLSLGWEPFASDHGQLPAVAIPAETSVSLVVMYFEGRAGQARSCGNVARFTPRAGREYEVHFDVTDESMQCPIDVEETGVGPLALEDSSACPAQTGAGGKPLPNGVGVAGPTTRIVVQPAS